MSPVILLIIGLVVVLAGILWLKFHPVIALLMGALIVGALTSEPLLERYAESKGLSEKQTSDLLAQSLGERVAIGFGNTCEKIGLLIVLASIIGKCLLDSGAAERIVRSMLCSLRRKKSAVVFYGQQLRVGYSNIF